MKRIIVGAGLSGMVAAINLAQSGHEVEILEKAPGIGGVSIELGKAHKQRYVFGDMTPFDLESLSSYINVDFRQRHPEIGDKHFFKTLPLARLYSYGKKYDMHFPEKLQIKLIERGPRKSSLDYFLYLTAKQHGVKFHFGTSIDSKNDLNQLPPGTILSTGMFIGNYQMLGIPHSPVYAYMASAEMADYKGPKCIAHFDKHMKDFALFTVIGGVGAATLFQIKQPLTKKTKEWYLNDIAEKEDITFSKWNITEARMAIPSGSIRNPRLFHKKFILSGSLAGMQTPFGGFGVHGGLVSGKIAAMAVENREKSMIEFKRMSQWWKLCYAIKKLMDVGHPHVPRFLLNLIFGYSDIYDLGYLFRYLTAIPGFMELRNNNLKKVKYV